MTNWKTHKDLQQALRTHLSIRGWVLDDNIEYESGIDCVFVMLGGNPVFIVGLPPLSNYEVEETEHTDRYLRPQTSIAV